MATPSTATYRLNDGDYAIFDKAKLDPNYFTEFYLRGPNTGTYWRPVEEHSDVPEIQEIIDRWVRGYEVLWNKWVELGRPSGRIKEDDEHRRYDFTHKEKNYIVLIENDPDRPVFWQNHGFIFLPWQLEAYNAPQTTKVLLGGYGCLDASARIFDVETQRNVPVQELYEQKRAPLVLAWTGTRYVPIRASVPFIKGTDEVFEVKTRRGRTIRVTADHVFLTNQGWKKLRELTPNSGIALVGCAQGLVPLSYETSRLAFLQDALHYWKTTPDSQGHYWTYLRPYDEQPHPAQGSAQDIVPSQVDALEYNRLLWRMDVLEGLSRTYNLDPNDALRSMQDSFLQNEAQSYSHGECSAVSESAEGVQDQRRETQSQPKSLYKSSSGRDIQEFWVNDRQNAPYASGDSVYQAAYSVPFNSSGIDNYTTYDEVISISSVGMAEYYDLHVPVWQNYLAEGLVNHNSAKSWEEMTANLIRAATLNNFRAVVIAPYSVQSMEIYEQVKILISGTEYDKRFVQGRTPQKPFPRIVVKNDKVGESRIEFYSIQDGFDKILNLSFDCAHIEQAEQIEDIRGLMRVVGSRLRGQVGGRERLGIMTFVANSSLEENIELWDLYDEAIEHPEHVYAKSPTTFDNIYITPRQLKDIERRMGDDPHIKDIALKGARPIGSGEHFPAESIQKSRSSMLDDMMQKGRDAKKDGYKYVVAPKAQVVSWRIPPDPKGTYFMCADPGWSNPPERNSAAIMVFEIGNFPQVPAHLHAFEWVYGNGAPEPWLNAYVDLCLQYNCVNRNVFDSTGLQAGYERWVHGLQDLGPWALNLGGAKKFIALNSAKTLMHRGLFQFPNIPMLFNQMAKYKLPDDKLRQDLVMTVVLAASYLDYLFYGAFIGDPPSVQAKKSEREVFRSREVNHAR